MDDQIIIVACQRGQPERFAELYDRYIDHIYAFVYARTGDRPTAEDLTSQTWLKAFERLPQFRHGSFQAWLYRIARNTVIDHYRTHRSDQNIETIDPAAATNLEQSTGTQLELDRVRRALTELPDAMAEVLQLRLWEELPFATIAELTGRSEASCKMTASRGLRLIRESLNAA